MLAGIGITAFAAGAPSPEQTGGGNSGASDEITYYNPTPKVLLISLANLSKETVENTEVIAESENGDPVEFFVDTLAEKDTMTEAMQADLDKLAETADEAEKDLSLDNVNKALEASSQIPGLIEKAEGRKGSATLPMRTVAESYPLKLKLPVADPELFLAVLVNYGNRWFVPKDMFTIVENDITYVVFTIEAPAFISLLYINGTVAP